jgi:hypothetical protein
MAFGGAESRANCMREPLGGRIHLSVVPSPAELEQARERLSRESCPRRYCWYWRTLSYDWELSPAEGCEVAERHITRLLLGHEQREPVPAWQACCRASGNPQHPDFYERREPPLKADGWPTDFFRLVGKAARRRRFERRKRGKRRQQE